MSQQIEVKIDYHAAQAKIAEDPTRFKVVFAGRRFGKTRLFVNKMVERRLEKSGSLGWWVGPTYKQARIAYRYTRRLFRSSGIIRKFNDSDLSMQFINDSVEEFKSGEILDNLVGEGLSDVEVDEAGLQREDLWPLVLRPMLMDSGGEADFFGTPRGMNWFYQLWLKGKSGTDKSWKSWKFSTYSNPYINPKEIAKAEEEMPELVARQEIHAEPIENEGMVFRNVDLVAKAKAEEPDPKAWYTVGVDLAKYQDFTVISVRRGLRQVHIERFNKIDWALQKERIIAVAKHYNDAKVLVDSTGVGDPIFEDLKRSGLHVDPYQLTSVSKKELIDNLILMFDKKELQILPDVVQLGELKTYQYELTSGGRLRTGAPAGKHDDTVIALALNFWHATADRPAQQTLMAVGGGRAVPVSR